jgi:hypothetical protein
LEKKNSICQTVERRISIYNIQERTEQTSDKNGKTQDLDIDEKIKNFKQYLENIHPK